MKTTSLLTGMGISAIAFLSLYNLSNYGKSRINSTPGIELSSSADTAYSPMTGHTPKMQAIAAVQNTKVPAKKVSLPIVSRITTPDSHVELNDIVYIENESETDLGFEVEAYLPADFDPYAGMPGNLKEISFVENEEDVELGFDATPYLPDGFNPYIGLAHGPEDINYLENEDIELGFDTAEYLPADFDPYARKAPSQKLDLDEIIYIEEEEPVEIELGSGLLEFIPS